MIYKMQNEEGVHIEPPDRSTLGRQGDSCGKIQLLLGVQDSGAAIVSTAVTCCVTGVR